ncbi:MAG TPA: UDP-N-acetylmuramate dehydrogenase [Lapillicoccus sp.]|nr:UDP-N-acetylmuramate dehydrogenase [Lapillicoccus sp.]
MREEAGVPLAGLTTMRVGGPAARLVRVGTTDELVDAVREVDDADEPLLVLGGGSNLVVADDGFPGTVVRVETTGIHIESDDRCGGANVRVAAGEPWDDLVAHAVEQGWSGIEALSGIPGSTGATPIQNVGAYGQEVAETVAQVRVWDRRDGQVRTLFGSDCGFTYRDSRFKRDPTRFVVLDVLFQLRIADLSEPIRYADLARSLDVELGERVPLADARGAVLDQRRRRGMVLDAADHDTWSCGSFFTNPILPADEMAALAARAPGLPVWDEPDGRRKTSAAWLIERAGFAKGFGSPGPAALSDKHTLAVTNRGSARAEDVVALARVIQAGVEDRFGIRLVNEPVLIGLSL